MYILLPWPSSSYQHPWMYSWEEMSVAQLSQASHCWHCQTTAMALFQILLYKLPPPNDYYSSEGYFFLNISNYNHILIFWALKWLCCFFPDLSYFYGLIFRSHSYFQVLRVLSLFDFMYYPLQTCYYVFLILPASGALRKGTWDQHFNTFLCKKMVKLWECLFWKTCLFLKDESLF